MYDCVASEEAVGYIATVKVSGKVYTSKPHGTKRAAETDAAAEAVKALGLVGSHGEYQPPQGKAGAGYYGGGHAQQSSALQPQSEYMYMYSQKCVCSGQCVIKAITSFLQPLV